MKRRPASKLGMLLSSMLIIGGTLMLLWPRDMTVFHAQGTKRQYAIGHGQTHLSVEMTRVVGGVAVLAGLSILALSVYWPRLK